MKYNWKDKHWHEVNIGSNLSVFTADNSMSEYTEGETSTNPLFKGGFATQRGLWPSRSRRFVISHNDAQLMSKAPVPLQTW
jgi:hypothetical protein